MELNGNIHIRKFTEDEEIQNSLILSVNKPGLNGFLKTFMSISNNMDLLEDQFKRKISFSPNFIENEEYEGKSDEIKRN